MFFFHFGKMYALKNALQFYNRKVKFCYLPYFFISISKHHAFIYSFEKKGFKYKYDE